MADMGVGLAYGAGGAAEALRQIIKDRIDQRQAELAMQLQSRSADRADRALDQNDALRRDALGERRDNAQAIIADRTFKENTALNDQMPPNTFLEPNSPLVGRLQSVGALKPQDERAPVDVGPLQPGDDGGARKQGFLKMASQKQNMDAVTQADKEADNARQLSAVEAQGKRDSETVRHNKAMENKPVSEAGWTTQQGMVGGKPGWVRINSRTGEVRPVDPGEITPKPSAQETEHARTNKDAIDTLNQLDQSIDAAKDMIGPGMGRVSNLEQMAGSADPRIQALGVKMKAAKMRVDHAITGSVRAGASPVLLAQWDNIFANKVTPEGLKAGVQALREILGGGSGDSGGGLPTVGGTFQGGRVLKVEKVE